MAKKRKTLSPTSSMRGAKETAKRTTNETVSKLRRLLAEQEINIEEFLAREFNFNSEKRTRTFKTADGQLKEFYEINLSAEDVEAKTCVPEDINGRAQDSLDISNCSDLESVSQQQYIPAFGMFDESGKIVIIDGSRRRLMYLHYRPDYPFKILVTEDSLSSEQAKQLSNELQTAKSHNARDKGKQLKAILESNPDLSLKDLGDIQGVDKSLAFNRLRAAAIPSEVMRFFPLGVSSRQFKQLSNLLLTSGMDGEMKYPVQDCVNILEGVPLQEPGTPDSEHAAKLINVLSNNLGDKTLAENKPKPEPLLPEFNSKKQSATVTKTTSGMTTLKFKGISDEALQQIIQQARDVLSKS